MAFEKAFQKLNAPYFDKGTQESLAYIKKHKLKSKPKVTVIIPAYNTAKTIEICIKSILNQTYKNVEFIINDAKSNDGSIDIIRKYKKVKLVFKNTNRSAARNISAKAAQGKYLFHIDSDMELSPRLIEECVARCEAEKYDALVVPEVSVGTTFWGLCRAIEKLSFLNDKYMESANRFIRKSAYWAVGGYDDSITAGEDFDIHQRLMMKKFKLGRASAYIKHHEVLSIFQTWRKGYIYGRTFKTYINKYPVLTAKQFSVIRPAYIRNWKLFLVHPVLTLGLAFMKGVMYIYTAWGMFVTFITGKHTRT